jgi:carbonic anhydrase
MPINQIFKNNQQWSAAIKKEDPEFFEKLAKQQHPEFLWIGCSDSRVPANQLCGLLPGEVFVHRNIANQVIHTDLNCLSVLHYAVEVLQVKHVIVCGHYGCGGVMAAYGNQRFGMIDNWLRHIKDVYRLHQQELDSISDYHEKMDRYCELNVIEQVANVCNSSPIQDAWQRKQPISVHGFVYRLHDGLLKNLNVSVSGLDN